MRPAAYKDVSFDKFASRYNDCNDLRKLVICRGEEALPLLVKTHSTQLKVRKFLIKCYRLPFFSFGFQFKSVFYL